MKNHQVTIYTLPICGYCQTAKEYFKQNNIVYKEIDVDKDDAAAAAMVKKTGQYGVPVIEIDGQTIIGFQKELLDTLLIN